MSNLTTAQIITASIVLGIFILALLTQDLTQLKY